MGYRSDLVIAVHGTILAHDLISSIIPRVLKELKSSDVGGIRYWRIEQWKWYREYADVWEIEAFFSFMDTLSPVPCHPDDPNTTRTTVPYGAIRIGEDMVDIEEWGSPMDYELFVERNIVAPTE